MNSDAKASMVVDFWSSVEYTAYTRELGVVLRTHGIALRSRFQVPQSEYWVIHSGFLSRVWLRLRMYAIYPLQLAWDFLFRREPRVAIVCTTCFYGPWLAARCGGRRRRVVNLLYDLYPESLIESGVLHADSSLARLLRWMATDTMKHAAANVLLGERLDAYARQALPDADHSRSHIIPVGAVEQPFEGFEPSPASAGRVPEILYCGNMGHAHDVDTVARYLAEGRTDGVCWRFHATGAGYARLRQQLAAADRPPASRPLTSDLGPQTSGAALHLGTSLQDAEWGSAMKDAEVALVTMRPGAGRVLVPSKMYSALLAGQAILAICPDDSDLADLVRRDACGWVVAPGDVGGLRTVVDRIAADPDEVLRCRRNARAAGLAHYGLSVVGAQWATLLRQVAAEVRDGPSKTRGPA